MARVSLGSVAFSLAGSCDQLGLVKPQSAKNQASVSAHSQVHRIFIAELLVKHFGCTGYTPRIVVRLLTAKADCEPFFEKTRGTLVSAFELFQDLVSQRNGRLEACPTGS